MPEASVRQSGPWVHRDVSAGGISFHVAMSGEGPHTVFFLHDFPLYWRSWRAPRPVLAEAGYRAVALDLRGFGGSDLQPGEVPLRRLATDVTSVVRALGSDSYTLVGAGMGGTLGWLLAHEQPLGMRSLLTVSCPHPLARSSARKDIRPQAAKANRLAHRSWGGRRSLQNGRLVAALLSGWTSPTNRLALADSLAAYSDPMRRRFAAQAALATFETTQHIRLTDRSLFEQPVALPVGSVHGSDDPSISPRAYLRSNQYTSGNFRQQEVPGVGRYLSEEAPAAMNRLILEHLDEVLSD